MADHILTTHLTTHLTTQFVNGGDALLSNIDRSRLIFHTFSIRMYLQNRQICIIVDNGR